jgi:hypothetical protein
MTLNYETIRGFCDADGSILFQVRLKNGKLSFSVTFQIDQALYQKENIDSLAATLGVKPFIVTRKSGRNPGSSYSRLTCSLAGEAGQKLTEIYSKNPPLVAARRRQFRVAQAILAITSEGKYRTPAEIAEILMLMRFALQNAATTKQKKDNLTTYLNSGQSYGITPQDYAIANQKTKAFIEAVDNELLALSQSLPNNQLSYDYIRGSNLGDGSTGCINQEQNGKLFIKPRWTISAHRDDIPLLEAFRNTLNAGFIQSTNNAGVKFVIDGRKDFAKVLCPVFEPTWAVSGYKEQQWLRTYEALKLIENNEHRTSQNWNKLIDLTYGTSINNKRVKSKDYYKNSRLIPKDLYDLSS